MTVKFNLQGMGPEFAEVEVPEWLTKQLDGLHAEIEDDDHDGDIVLDDDDPHYYDITFRFDTYSITLEAVSNYHLTEVK